MFWKTPHKTIFTIVIGTIIGAIFLWSVVSWTDLWSIMRQIFGTGWTPLGWWQFDSTSGNGGKFSFDTVPTNTSLYPEAVIDGEYLTGYFWIDTIGWTRFDNTKIVAPWIGNIRNNWFLSGYAWNDNAGWIDMNGITYIPDTLVLSGYAWNQGIGWMHIFRNSNATTQNVSNVGSGFIGKVRILWNIWGSNIYSTTYSIDPTFKSLSLNSIMDVVRKNVTLATRNISIWAGQSVPWSTPIIIDKKIVYRDTGGTPVRYSDIASSLGEATLKWARSIIILWGDIYIDTGVTLANDGPRAIIALKNGLWERGDIYIRGNVTKIFASLVAEWTVKSAYVPPNPPGWAPYIYNEDKQAVIRWLPPYQLYVKGSIFSNNTIGGAANNIWIVRCPIIEWSCNYNSAVQYDLNYFRDFQIFDSTHRGYTDTRFDDYSLVIEYDTHLVSNPPPGLENITQ